MDEQLGAVLAVLVARTGARAARVVDARHGGVLALTGVIEAADVRALVALARDVPPAGGAGDLVLPTRAGVHVLRTFPGAFVHLHVDAGRAVGAARRELASPELRDAVGWALAGLAHRSGPPRPGPRPPGPAESDAPRPARQPALAVLGAPTGRPQPAGPLAVLALTPDAPVPATLPRRAVATAVPKPKPAVVRPLALPKVLKQEWAGDAATMARLLDGLRRLN